MIYVDLTLACDVCNTSYSKCTIDNKKSSLRKVAYSEGCRRVWLNGELSDICPKCYISRNDLNIAHGTKY